MRVGHVPARDPQRPVKRFRRTRFLDPEILRGLFGLTPRACWSRLQRGRSPFAPTFPDRRPNLPRASLPGRPLSREPYLRPTPQCDCHAPEIVAVADELRRGAASDWEYAEAVYNFTTHSVVHAMEGAPRGVVDTLRSGYGLCYDKVLLFMALARAGGLQARCCRLRFEFSEDMAIDRAPWVQILSRLGECLDTRNDRRVQDLAVAWQKVTGLVQEVIEERLAQSKIDGRPFTLETAEGPHPLAEVNVGDVWIPVDPSTDDAECAYYGLPLQRFGYLPGALRMVRGSISTRLEAPTFGVRPYLTRLLVCSLARGAVDELNRSLEEARRRGQRILDDVGLAEYMSRHRRFYVPVEGLSALGITLPPHPTA